MPEEGSGFASELWTGGHAVVSSVLAYAEGRATLGAAHRGGRLTATSYAEAVADFDELHGELPLVGVDPALSMRAGELAADLGLRGYDAVHLATALGLAGETTIVTWDADLADAALVCGCGVAPAR